MKKSIIKKILIILILIVQMMQISGELLKSMASIKEGDIVLLEGDHECDSLLEYWMEDYQKWSYKVVWYVYYQDKDDGNIYPAFCIEPKKEGVGTGYDSYDALIKNENDNRIWRILNKGYIESNYKDWNLECDDDLYSAIKVALHSLAEGIEPKDKYILGTRSVDGNTVEDIQRRGEKVLNVAQTLYEYGVNGKEIYEKPKINVYKKGEMLKEQIENTEYYIQNYTITANKSLKSYEIQIKDFPSGTKIFNSKNEEKSSLSEKSFKIAIPINKITKDIKGTVNINNAYIKTNPVYFCKSSVEEAQSYVTYSSGYEVDNTSDTLEVKANNCDLIIEKVDKETNEVVPNVTFKIEDKNGNIIDEITTNEEGIGILKNAYPGEITISEIDVPNKYIISNEKKNVELKWGESIKIKFENEKKKGNLEITKVDKDNNEIKLEGVEFEIWDDKNNLIDKSKTDQNGKIYIEKLDIGEYIIKETETKQGYNLKDNIQIKINWNETTSLKIENEKQKGQIEVYKIDSEDKKQKLENVVFEVLNDKKQSIETIITDKNGYAITSSLPIGKYYLKEIKTSNKYLLNQDLIEVEVKKDDITTVQVKNEKIKGQIKILKISQDDNLINGKKNSSPIANVIFEIRTQEGKIVDTIMTNENGVALSKQLEKGKYIVKEIKTDDNYILNNEEFIVEIKENKKQEEITITNLSKKPEEPKPIEPPKLPRTGF